MMEGRRIRFYSGSGNLAREYTSLDQVTKALHCVGTDEEPIEYSMADIPGLCDMIAPLYEGSTSREELQRIIDNCKRETSGI